MALSEEDVQAIGRMLDQRLEQVQARERRRRRWRGILILLVLALLSLALWIAAQRWMAEVGAALAEQDRAFQEMKVEYQRQLAASEQLQKERAEAETAARYDRTRSRASYEAGLVSGLFKLYGQQRQLQERLRSGDLDDPDALDALAGQYASVADGGLQLLMQMLLRHTDPALNTPTEDLLVHGEGGGSATGGALLPEAP